MDEVINLAPLAENDGKLSKHNTTTNETEDTKRASSKLAGNHENANLDMWQQMTSNENDKFSGSAQSLKQIKLWIFLKKVKDTANADIKNN